MQAHLAQQRQALPASPDRACVQMCVTGRGPHMSQGWESFAQRLVTCGRLTVWSLRLSCICNPPPASCCTSLRTAPASCCTSCAVEGVNQASCLLPLSCADTTCRIASLVPMCQCGGLHHTVKQVHVTQYSHLVLSTCIQPLCLGGHLCGYQPGFCPDSLHKSAGNQANIPYQAPQAKTGWFPAPRTESQLSLGDSRPDKLGILSVG